MSKIPLLLILAGMPLLAQLKSGPPLKMEVVKDWAKLPKGWNLGQTSGVSVDKDDNVWVFNRGAHSIIQFDRDGNVLQSIAETGVKSSHGIEIDPEGNVWAVDVEGHNVMKFTPGGRLLMVIGANGAGDNDTKEGFNRPTAVAFLPGGGFLVSDGYVNSRVVRYTQNGDYVKHWGRKGKDDGEFDLVHDVCLDESSRVYVCDRANSRVQIFDTEGKFLGKWTDLGQPWGITYSKKDKSLFVADGLNDRVVKVNLDGQILGVLGSHGKMPGKFDFAHHIAVDSQGAIYVAEIKNWRVQKFVPAR